jgi:hypothetical protein
MSKNDSESSEGINFAMRKYNDCMESIAAIKESKAKYEAKVELIDSKMEESRANYEAEVERICL